MAYSRQRLPNTTPLSRGEVKARFVTNTAEKYSRTWPNSWNIHVMHVIFDYGTHLHGIGWGEVYIDDLILLSQHIKYGNSSFNGFVWE